MANSANQLERKLKTRHLTMLALGGTLGTGLLLASGSAIHRGGAGGAILAYGIVAILVYFLMTSLGEMANYAPKTGSFCEYSAKYVDKAFGFAMSWNYWLNWVLVVASEVIAAGLVMQFWFPHVNVWVWTIFFFLLTLGLNLFAVRFYGETEYWLSFVKVATVIIFIIVSGLSIFGLIGSHGPVGFKNITLGDGPFHAGFLGFLAVFLVAGYSFQGTELVGVAAGEAMEPDKSIPKAVNIIFWRIVIFYILTITAISFLIPYTNDLLANPHSHVALSPFTLIFQEVGLKYAASIMNLVIVTAILSTANSSLYTASRVLWHMGQVNEAPRWLRKTSVKGVPILSVWVSALFCALFCLLSIFNSGAIFNWLIDVISLAGYIAWFGISLSHYRFRRAYLLQGNDLNQLTYRARLFPLAPLCAMVMIALIMVGQQIMPLLYGQAVTWKQFITTYGGVIAFLALFVIYKGVKKTKLVPLAACDLTCSHHDNPKETLFADS